jgi:hypothetical protein
MIIIIIKIIKIKSRTALVVQLVKGSGGYGFAFLSFS